MNEKAVVYVYSDELKNQCNRLPTLSKRAEMVQDLIESYELLGENVTVVESIPATEDEIKLFHSSSYVDFMKKTNKCSSDDFELFETEANEFGLSYDCPLLENNYDFIRVIAGGTLTAAKLLGEYEIAINWFGGWHHAQRDSAEGFCYVNDIVIALQTLTERFSRILYLDLDVHHGNGVQNAFELSKKVLTLSFHKFSPGFYPGSGDLDDVGLLGGKNYSVNVPYLDGIDHKSFLFMFRNIFPRVVELYKPEVIVVQCGGDALIGDPIGECNLILETFGECVKNVLSVHLPVLLLGGGGYNLANTARLWTYITALVIGKELHEDIPDKSEFFTKYGPSYELAVKPGLQKNCNTEAYLQTIIMTVLERISNIVA